MRPRDVAVAVVAGDLLDHVDLGDGVGPEGRHGHELLGAVVGSGRRDLEPDRAQQAGDPGGGELGTEDGVHTGRAHRHRDASGTVTVDIDRSGGERDARRGQQLGEAQRGHLSDLGVAAALEAGRRLAAQVQPLRRPGDRHGVPPGHLQQHRCGGVGDLGRRATHHTGDADRHVVGIGQDAVTAGEGALHAVERDDALAVARPTHPQVAVAELREVVGVAGLAQLEHHVVGRVDHVVDRAHAECGEPIGQPARRRADGDVVQHPSVEAPAELGGGDLDRRPAGERGRGRRDRRGHLGEGDAEPGRQVACHSGHRHGVGPVRVDLQVVEDVVDDTEGGLQVSTRRGGGVEDQDALVIVAETELATGAEHAVRPLAAQLATLDLHAVAHDGAEGGQRHVIADGHVERTAADLQRLAVAGIHVDQLDLVGVGVRSEVEHLGDDDAVEAATEVVDRLDRHPEVAHLQAERDRVALDRGELLEPREQHLHGAPPTRSSDGRAIRTAPGSGRRC